MKAFKTKFGSINTPCKALIFLPTLQNKKRGRQIYVQPTSISRRKSLITSASRKEQTGRPTVDVTGQTKIEF